MPEFLRFLRKTITENRPFTEKKNRISLYSKISGKMFPNLQFVVKKEF